MKMGKNITGQKFGRLTAIEPTIKRNKQGLVIWKFQCNCGNIVEKVGREVWRGQTSSCGCLKKELLIKRNTENNSNKYFIGAQFGELTIISNIFFKLSPRGKNESWVKCQCSCGNIIEVKTNNLGSRTTQSCGCVQSLGEKRIIKLLKENDINFSTQYTFSDLIGPKGGKLRFDFAIFKNNQLYELIEFDGRQHFFDSNDSWKNSDSLIEIQFRDNLKNEYCRKNNIKLIRIPYTKIDNINLELLQLTDYLLEDKINNENV